MKRMITVVYYVLSFVSQIVSAVIIGLALTPAILIIQWGLRQAQGLANPIAGAVLIGLSVGVGYMVFGNLFLIFIVLTRYLLRLKNFEKAGDFYALSAVRTAAYNYLLNLSRHVFLNVVRGTPFIVWFYRALGAKIGRNTFILSTRLYDLDMLEIGNDCVIGGNVAINAHTVEGSRGVMHGVKIGNRVSIGADTMILPGVVMEDGVTIGACSLIPKHSHLKAGCKYGGVPIRPLD
jgi:acetyltransferase-like isoleucine patch superfamily enzyme